MSMSTESQTETTTTNARSPRFDVYGPIHKAIRKVVSELLVRMGRTSFADAAVARTLTEELEGVLRWCEEHIEHEVEFVHPALAQRVPGALAKIDQGHDDHARLVGELRGLIVAVDAAPSPELRVRAGHTLYLHYATFVAETLVHMVEEERVVQPLMHRFFTDAELMKINDAIIQSMAPPEMLDSLSKMFPALNGPERAALLGGANANAPPEAMRAIVDVARSRLEPGEWAEVVALCPFLQ